LTVVVDTERLIGGQIEPPPRTSDDEQGRDHDREHAELGGLRELVFTGERQNRWRQDERPQDETTARDEVAKEEAMR